MFIEREYENGGKTFQIALTVTRIPLSAEVTRPTCFDYLIDNILRLEHVSKKLLKCIC